MNNAYFIVYIGIFAKGCIEMHDSYFIDQFECQKIRQLLDNV